MLPGNVPKTKQEYRDAYSRKAESPTPFPVGMTQRTTTGMNKTVLTFKNTLAPLIDTPGVIARCPLKVLTLTEGLIQVFGATANLVLTKNASGVINTWAGLFGLGSAAAAADATLTGTEQNFIPSTVTPAAVAGVAAAKGLSTAQVLLDGTATPIDVYLNLIVNDTDHDVTTTPTSLILNGTLTFMWANYGDK